MIINGIVWNFISDLSAAVCHICQMIPSQWLISRWFCRFWFGKSRQNIYMQVLKTCLDFDLFTQLNCHGTRWWKRCNLKLSIYIQLHPLQSVRWNYLSITRRAATQVVEWMGKITPHVDRHMITYSYRDESEVVLMIWAPGYKACLIVNFVM